VLTEAFTLLIQLPPLAFGPDFPRASTPPAALVCPVRELGRIQQPERSTWSASPTLTLDQRRFKPTRDQYLVNQTVDRLLLLAAVLGTRASWDDRTWSTKTWEATGAVAPLLIPPQAPPMWDLKR
jgi:hypothetical protein